MISTTVEVTVVVYMCVSVPLIVRL